MRHLELVNGLLINLYVEELTQVAAQIKVIDTRGIYVLEGFIDGSSCLGIFLLLGVAEDFGFHCCKILPVLTEAEDGFGSAGNLLVEGAGRCSYVFI